MAVMELMEAMEASYAPMPFQQVAAFSHPEPRDNALLRSSPYTELLTELAGRDEVYPARFELHLHFYNSGYNHPQPRRDGWRSTATCSYMRGIPVLGIK